jgi:hypothetical protein
MTTSVSNGRMYTFVGQNVQDLDRIVQCHANDYFDVASRARVFTPTLADPSPAGTSGRLAWPAARRLDFRGQRETVRFERGAHFNYRGL